MNRINYKLGLILFSVFISLLLNIKANAQKLRWALPPNQVNFNSSPVSSSPLAPTLTTPYVTSNSATDKNGTLLFWVNVSQSATGNSIQVYSPSGTSIGTLNPIPQTDCYRSIHQEVSIVPVPGSVDCKDFYVIWFEGCQSGAQVKLGYAKINCSSGVVISQQSTPIQWFNSVSGSLAVTKMFSGNVRYLFTVTHGKLNRYTITSTGITTSSEMTVATNAANGAYGLNITSFSELEVSLDARRVAFANSAGGDITIYQINMQPVPASTYINENYYHGIGAGGGGYKGLEYSKDGKRLFACHLNQNVQWFWANFYTGPPSNQQHVPINDPNRPQPEHSTIPNTSTYTNSHLELGKDGKIYVANLTGQLAEITTTGTPSIAPSNLGLTVYSNSPVQMTGQIHYRLPDQIDGDYYASSCCPDYIFIEGTYNTYLTESGNWIKSTGSTIIDPANIVQLDANPSNGYIELNPGFISEPSTGFFVAQLIDGCGIFSPITSGWAVSSASACDSYYWPASNQTYSVSGVYVLDPNVSSSVGNILNLTINNSTATNQNETICNSYTWAVNGNTYTSSGTYSATTMNAEGCSEEATLQLTIPTVCNAIVNIKCFIEGYWDGVSAMVPVMANQGVVNTSTACDSITLELHDSNSPYSTLYTTQALLNQDGTASFVFASAVTPGNYYFVVKHRNALQTWSALPIVFNGSTVNYDFTTAADKAYGSNQVQVATGIWAFYSADVNQDENTDLLDLAAVESEINNFSFGYFAEDINGDGNVDLLDISIVESNINNFIFSVHP